MLSGVCIAHICLNDYFKRPINSWPLWAISTLTVFSIVVFFFWGLFSLTWWMPLASAFISWLVVPFIYYMFVRLNVAALISILLSLLGLCSAIYLVARTHLAA